MTCTLERINQAVEDYRSGKNRKENFELIYTCCYGRVRKYFTQPEYPQNLSEDLTQEVFIRVYKNLETFRGEMSFIGWLYMIAETVYLDEVRRGETKKRHGMTVSLDTGGQDEDGEPAPMSLPDDSEASKPLKLLLDKERNQRLEEAIRRLPTQMRSCFIFRYNHSMSYQQIAVEMRLSIDAVKSHLKEARKRLIADEDIKDS